MIEEGQFKILGGNHIIFVYLAKNSPQVGQKLVHPELDQKIKGVIGWHQAKMMIPGTQMFKIQCQPDQFKVKTTKEQYSKWEQDFLQCLQGLDMKLVEHSYLCGEKMTIADIIVFNELSMFVELNPDKNMDSAEMSAYPNLVKWFNTKMLANAHVKQCNDEMKMALSSIKKSKPE